MQDTVMYDVPTDNIPTEKKRNIYFFFKYRKKNAEIFIYKKNDRNKLHHTENCRHDINIQVYLLAIKQFTVCV